MIRALDPRDLKRRADFVVLASRYTRLRRAGSQYRGLCPFHLERNPSLYIEPQQKIWKCFGCGKSGDLLDFLILAQRCDFPTALRIVSDFVGVARESEPRSGERFRAREGAGGPSAREAGAQHSPNTRDSILARLAETERRNTAIRAANNSAFAEFATACEPERGGDSQIYTPENNFQRGA